MQPRYNAHETLDDSLLRWSHQCSYEIDIWNYFNEVVTKDIIFKAHEEKIRFANLYQKLALARAKCEWMKDYFRSRWNTNEPENKPSEQLFKSLLTSTIPWHTIDDESFASFRCGRSWEQNILSSWGKTVAAFSEKRLKHASQENPMMAYPGLSSVGVSVKARRNSWDDDDSSIKLPQVTIWHPRGTVLDKLENDFQLLCNTTTIFEYFKIASRICYMLSNFPPTGRGSSAICTWIIDKMGQKRFNFITSTKPHLYDWTAFYETADQYTGFYVISAATAYIQSLNIYPEIDAFSKRMTAIMEENPNDIAALEKRRKLWEELQSITQFIIETRSDSLEPIQLQRLCDIHEGHLEFKKVSDQAIRISERLSPLVKNGILEDFNTALNAFTPKDGEDKAEVEADKRYFEELICLKYQMANKYLAAFGDTIQEDSINRLWPDCEFLHAKIILPKWVFQLYGNILSSQETELEKKFKTVLNNKILLAGFVNPEDIDKFLKFTELPKSLNKQLIVALRNGLQLTELNELIAENNAVEPQLDLLTSRAAVLLYQLDVPINNLLCSTREETEMHILRLVAKRYCQEALPDIFDAGIRKSLVSFLDSFLLRHMNMSQLVGADEDTTKKIMLTTYVKHHYLMDINDLSPEELVRINSISGQQATKLLNRIIDTNRNIDEGESNINDSLRMIYKSANVDCLRFFTPSILIHDSQDEQEGTLAKKYCIQKK